MATLPAEVNYGTVKGRLVKAVIDSEDPDSYPDSVPLVGTVTFTPQASALLLAGSSPPLTILPQAITIALDADGGFQVDLIATDDTDLNPVDWTYAVSFSFSGSGAPTYQSFSIEVPAGQIVDITTLAPVPSTGGTPIVQGQKGDPGPAVAPFTQTGNLSTGQGVFKWYNDLGRTLYIDKVRISVGTAPTGAPLIVDVHKNGTTVFTTQANRPTIQIGEDTDLSVAPDVLTIADGEYITVDIDQVGSTLPGANLVVQVVTH